MTKTPIPVIPPRRERISCAQNVARHRYPLRQDPFFLPLPPSGSVTLHSGPRTCGDNPQEQRNIKG